MTYDNGKIAICIATYNHPEAVEYILNQSIQDYYDVGIDVYYYDGSANYETSEIVKRYQKKGYTNLYYIHKFDDFAGKRVKMILTGEGLEKEYEYIWYSKDRCYCTKEDLQKIVYTAKRHADVIFLGAQENVESKILTYRNPAEFYRDWAITATSINTSIFRIQTMLEGFDYSKLFHKFGTSYDLLFKRLAELDSVQIDVIWDACLPETDLAKSQWESRVFTVWKDLWIEENRQLPDIYDEYKAKVIKQTASLHHILGGVARLVELQRKGILVPEKMDEIRNNWEMVSDMPIEVVEEIANGNFNAWHAIKMLQDGNEVVELLKQMTDLCYKDGMTKDQISFDTIHTIVIDTLKKKEILSLEELLLIEGAIVDFANISRKETTTLQECAVMLQSITMMVHLALSKEK